MDTTHSNLNFIAGDYIPNPNGYYAITTNFQSSTFNLDFAGKLVRCPYTVLRNLPQGKYYMVWMMRDIAEMEASSIRAFGSAPILYDIYGQYCDSLFKMLDARGDFTYVKLNYADVVAQPLVEFEKVDMPIDVNVAASLVDETLYRYRLENK
jgi:hypothetical protein